MPRPDAPRLLISDRYANVRLVNHFGQPVRFHDDLINGRALVVNTMFTVCRGSCPGTSAALEGLREVLWPVFGRGMVFASITLEPETDTPEVLRDYAAGYGADRPRDDRCEWHFLTGPRAAIEELRRSLELYDLDPVVDADPARHAAVIMFGNPRTDRWAVLPAALRQPLLVETIRRVCGTSFEQRYGIPG